MAVVLTVAQQKGGAGKTTIAAHLAVAFAELGHRVATVDIDPQGSLSRWAEERAVAGLGGVVHHRITGWRTAGEVDRIAREADIVVVDSPPHAETEARIAIRSADLVLVPIQPSPMDLWAAEPTLALARAEHRPVLLVLNRVPARARLAETLTRRIETLGVPVAETRLGSRIAYASALMEGRAVTETAGNRLAAEEIRALAREVLVAAAGR